MKKLLFILILSFLFSNILLANDNKNVALILEKTDAWSNLLSQAFMDSAKKNGLNPEIVMAPVGENQDNIFCDVAKKHSLVLVATPSLHEVLRNNAANFRRVHFGCIDTGVRAPNIMSVSFADEQVAYLSGIICAMLTVRTEIDGINPAKVVGWISDEDDPIQNSMFSGFTEGVKLIDPTIRTIRVIISSDNINEQLDYLVSQGVDVFVNGSTILNNLAINKISEKKLHVLSLHVPLPIDKNFMVATLVKRGDLAVQEIVEAHAKGAFLGKEIRVHSLKDKGVFLRDYEKYLSLLGKKAPPNLERRLSEITNELISESIRIKSLRIRTLCDCL